MLLSLRSWARRYPAVLVMLLLLPFSFGTVLAAQSADGSLKILTDAGAVVILALAVLGMAYVLRENNRSNTKTMDAMLAFQGRLATAVEKLEQHESDQTVVLRDVVSSNRQVVTSNDNLLSEIKLTRKSSDDHQIAVVETLVGVQQDVEKSRSSIVARQDLMMQAIEGLAQEIRNLQPDKGQLEKLQAIEHLIAAMDHSLKEVIAKCGGAPQVEALQPEAMPT